MSFDGKCQNLRTSLLTLLIFAKVWTVRTSVVHRRAQTERQGNGQAHRYKENLADFPKNMSSTDSGYVMMCKAIRNL